MFAERVAAPPPYTAVPVAVALSGKAKSISYQARVKLHAISLESEELYFQNQASKCNFP